MDINVYDVIVRPIVTPKAQRLNKELKQVVLEVHTKATKPMIARALKAVFNADALRIGIVTGATKSRRQAKGRKKIVAGKSYKRAIVTLRQGTESEIMNLSSAMPQGMHTTTETAE